MNKRIIVFGATGNTGIQICNELANHKLDFCVFSRKSSVEKLPDPKVEVKYGDVLNTTDVENAFLNESFTDVVVSLGSRDLKIPSVRSAGTANIIQAMDKTGSSAMIHVISSVGVNESKDQMQWYMKLIVNLLIKNTLKDHAAQEKVVRESKYKSHIIRPVGLRDGASKGEVHVQNEGYMPSGVIRRADVAKFLVQGIVNATEGVNSICQKK